MKTPNLNEYVPISGYEGKYLISKEGNVYSVKRKRLLRPFRSEKGYLVVELWNNQKRRSAKVHRLVAEAYIPNPDMRTEINHKDGNKFNNCVDNLEWCTRSENIKHAYDLGLRKRAYATGCKAELLDLIDTLTESQIQSLLTYLKGEI